MKFACGLIGADADAFAHDDGAFVDFLVQEKGGQSSDALAVDDGVVDGGGAAVLGQEGGVEGAS